MTPINDILNSSKSEANRFDPHEAVRRVSARSRQGAPKPRTALRDICCGDPTGIRTPAATVKG